MKSLVIAEKPSVGRDIARVLHCSKNIPGALEGDKYIVTWALGHLVTLADPEVCKSDYHCDRCRKRRRVGSTLDPRKIRMQKADQTSVDLLSHRQSHPRRICKPA